MTKLYNSNTFSIMILIALITILFCTLTTAQNTDPGSCLPIYDYTATKITYGYTAPACMNHLVASHITHYWSKHADVPDGNPNGDCKDHTSFIYDAPVQALAQVLTNEVPTDSCQHILGLTMCFAQFRRCDPEVDDVDGSGLYLTEEANKPCKWLCEVLHDDNTVCTDDDRDYLRDFGVDLDTVGSLPQLDCNNSEYWSQDTENCYAPSALLPRKLAPRCEEYSGSLCTAVFPSGTMVYVPPVTEQEEIEQYLPFSSMFNSLPLTNNTCAASWTRHQCQMVFQECVEHGLSEFDIDSTGLKPKLDPVTGELPVGIRRKHVFPLRTPQSSCEDYGDFCSTTRVFSTSFVQAMFTFPTCDVSAPIQNYNPCFPSGLDPAKAKDAPTSPNQSDDGGVIPTEPVQGDDEVIQPREANYTMAQINRINKVSAIYRFNAQAYLAPLQYDDITIVGPDTSDVVLHGQTRPATVWAIDEKALFFPPTCPSPLVIPTDYYATNDDEIGMSNIFGGRCALPCMNAAFTDDERTYIEIWSLIFVCGALLFSGILAVTFLVFKSQRHKRLLFWYVMTYFMVALFLFQGLMNRNGGESTYLNQCETNTHLYNMSGFSLYQALFLVYFILANSAWWAVQCIQLVEHLLLGRQFKRGTRQARHRNIAFHVFCWGMPALCCAAILCGAQFGYDGLLPFAFLAFDNQLTSDPINLSWAFFFGPILVLVGLGLIGVSVILFFLIRYDPTDGLKKFADSVSKHSSFWFKLQSVLKMLGFVLLQVLFIVLLVVHQILIGTYSAQWHKDLVFWAENILIFSGVVEIPPPASRMSPSFIVLTTFALASPGWMMFILYFLASTDIIKLWCGFFFFKLNMGCCKRYAKEDTATDGSTESSSSGSSAGSSDILTGENIVLTGKHSNTGSVNNDPSSPVPSAPSAPQPQYNNNNNNNNNGKIVSKQSSGHYPQTEQERRKMLFRGFKNNEVVTSGSVRARSSSQSVDRMSTSSFSNLGPPPLSSDNTTTKPKSPNGTSPSDNDSQSLLSPSNQASIIELGSLDVNAPVVQDNDALRHQLSPVVESPGSPRLE